jgi:outer membrane immunogenic protein
VSNTKTGWTAGAGAEWMFTRGWSAKMEYLHVDLGTDAMTKFFTSSTVNGIHFSWKTQEEIVRFGVNYHFN